VFKTFQILAATLSANLHIVWAKSMFCIIKDFGVGVF